MRLSPNQAWLVLQSETVKAPGGQQSRIFFDVFNTASGAKVLTIEGAYTGYGPDTSEAVLSTTGWLTDRYFIVPLGVRIDRLLVCEFGGQRNAGPQK